MTLFVILYAATCGAMIGITHRAMNRLWS